MKQQFKRVEELDLESLPRGSISKLFVTLYHDGLGEPVEVPLLVAKGEKRGPVFGITAAVHGNELNGIPVIHRLFSTIDVKARRGTIVAVVIVNIPGYLQNLRYFSGRDLNHIFPGKPGGHTAQVFVHRFMEKIVSKFEYLIDFHTASFGRVNSLYVRADMTNETTAQMAYLQRPQIIVHNPASDHTLRGSAMEMGIPAITLEIGNPQRFQSDYIKRSLVGLRAVLSEAKMIAKRAVSLGPKPFLCKSSYWLYTDAGGLLDVFPKVTDTIEKGETIARLSSIFGEVTQEYKSPEDGVVIGKSVNPVSPTGARILHIGLRATAEDRQYLERKEYVRPKKREKLKKKEK
jgi:uncharacterized protein